MAFGWPTWYRQIDPNTIDGGVEAWDRAVLDASEEYKDHIVCFPTENSFFNSVKVSYDLKLQETETNLI